MQNKTTLIIAGVALALLLLVAVYFFYVGNVEAGTGAGAAVALAVGAAKKSRDATREDVSTSGEELGDAQDAIKEILDNYEEEKSANVEAVKNADNEEKRAMGLAVLSPEMLAALDIKPEDIA